MLKTMAISGLKMRSKENPLALSAVSSLCSAKLPMVMSEESKMAKGKAKGMMLAETYIRSSKMTQTLRSLPMRSSM